MHDLMTEREIMNVPQDESAITTPVSYDEWQIDREEECR